MADMKDRAREYLRSQTQLIGGGLFHCNILNLVLGFAEQETKEQKDQLTKAKEYIKLLLMNCVGVYESTGKTVAEIQVEAEQFLKEE